MTFDRRLGLSVIELIVISLIVGILIAIAAPAILGVRETIRKSQCAHNLTQLGLACANFESRTGRLPSKSWILDDLASELEFNTVESVEFGRRVLVQSSPILKCPSEVNTKTRDGVDVGLNYFINGGAGIPPTFNGAVGKDMVGKGISLRDFVDGLSNTSLFSEHPLLETDCIKCSHTTKWWTCPPAKFTTGQEKELRNFLADCWQTQKLSPLLYTTWGQTEIFTEFEVTHHSTPDSPMILLSTDETIHTVYLNVRPPASRHSRGVNIVRADGSSTFILDTIDREVFAAIGTRNGADVVHFD